MVEIESSWEQRLQQARQEWEKSQEVTSEEMPAVWRRTPYVMNVNEDPQLSGVIKFGFARGKEATGRIDDGYQLKWCRVAILCAHCIVYGGLWA